MTPSTTMDFELGTGEHIKLTMNFKKLYELKSKRKDIYQRYNQVQMDGTKEIFDFILILYTAYLCALENLEEAMSEEEFIEALPPYPDMIISAIVELTKPKKATASERPSGEKEN